MKINIVISPLQRHKFSGGALCLLNHAQGLSLLGHEVTVLAMSASSVPEWYAQPWHFKFVSLKRSDQFQKIVHIFIELVKNLFESSRSGEWVDRSRVRRIFSLTTGLLFRNANLGVHRGIAIDNLLEFLPDADVTIATDYETAYPVALVGKGRKYYFSQHYEPYFWREKWGGEVSKKDAELTYSLGLRQIVNSPWLAEILKDKHGLQSAYLCPNAIDHQIFSAAPRPRRNLSQLKIISYGGREADWKGFREMCEAVALARNRCPHIQFVWSVYGDALLPPDNTIAQYESLGFLSQEQLAESYRQHDVLLSASWYESFPLFPLEAMASGIPPICTQNGTELFASHGETAEIVLPKSVESIANALIVMAQNEPYRMRLAEAGYKKSMEFNWESATKCMNEIIGLNC